MPRWVVPVGVLSAVVGAIVVGVLWYVIGGWPRDHNRYGEVAIPGARTLELPKGEVRLSFEGEVSGGGEARTLEDPPEGLRVHVRPRRGRPLKVESVSGSLYGIFSGDRGREPFGKLDVPRAGRYRVRTSARGASPSGEITAGPEFWNPLGSRVAGALVISIAAFLALLLFVLPVLLLARRRPTTA